MKTILLFASLASVMALGACKGEEAAALPSDLSVAQVEEALKLNPRIQLIDVRSKSEWDSGRIKGAVLIPITEFKARLAEVDRTRPVITYCASGGRSQYALDILAEAGYPKGSHLAVGIDGWLGAGKAVEK